MKNLQLFVFNVFIFSFVWLFFCSASSFPVEPPKETIKLTHNQILKIKRLETKLKKAEGAKRIKIEKRIKKIKYGERGDALGLAALVAGILSILLSIIVLAFLGMEWQLLVFIGLLLGAASIIAAIVDLRYTDMPGQAYAAIIAGGLGLIAGALALIFLK